MITSTSFSKDLYAIPGTKHKKRLPPKVTSQSKRLKIQKAEKGKK